MALVRRGRRILEERNYLIVQPAHPCHTLPVQPCPITTYLCTLLSYSVVPNSPTHGVLYTSAGASLEDASPSSVGAVDEPGARLRLGRRFFFSSACLSGAGVVTGLGGRLLGPATAVASTFLACGKSTHFDSELNTLSPHIVAMLESTNYKQDSDNLVVFLRCMQQEYESGKQGRL